MTINSWDRFLLWLAGTDLKIIGMCSSSAISTRKAQGLLLLIPACVAVVAGYTFFITLFNKGNNPQLYAVFAAVTWGVMILNLDRYLLMTLKKSDSAINDLFSISGLTRLIVAGFIGFVLAHPIILNIYADHLYRNINQRYLVNEQSVASRFDSKFQAINKKISARNVDLTNMRQANFDVFNEKPSPETSELRALIQDQQQLLLKTESEYADEVAGKSKRTEKKGVGPVALAIFEKIKSIKKNKKALEQQLKDVLVNRKINKSFRNEQMKNELIQVDNQREFIKNELASLLLEKNNLQKEKKMAIEKVNSFESYDFSTLSNELDRLEKTNSTVHQWKWLITGLLWALDVLIILLKITSPRDEYDDLKDIHKIANEQTNDIRLNGLRQDMFFVEKRRTQKAFIAHNLSTLDMTLKSIEKSMIKMNQLAAIEEKNRSVTNNDAFSEFSRGYRVMATKMMKEMLSGSTV